MNFKLLCFSISIFILVRCTSNENGSSKHSKQNRISSSTNNINNSQKPYHDSLVFHLGNDKRWYSLKFVVDPSKVNSLRIIKFYKEGTLIQTIRANKYIENEHFKEFYNSKNSFVCSPIIFYCYNIWVIQIT